MSLENVYNKVCRTCLIENSAMKSVFSVEKFMFMEEQAMLCDILMYCASVQIAKGDGLPEQVCTNCAQEMNRAFVFRKLCERSDSTLRHYLNSLQVETKYCEAENPNVHLKVEAEYCAAEDPSECLKVEANSNGRLQQNKKTQTCKESDAMQKCEMLHSHDIDHSKSDYLFQENFDCDKDSETIKEQLKENISSKLSNGPKKKTYTCKLCEEGCLGLAAYRRHMASAHNQLFKCEVCGKEFKSEILLNRHKKDHESYSVDLKREQQTESRPYKTKTGIIKKRNMPRTCTICNKTFRFHSNLERHKLIHTGEKPFLCNVCGKGFAQLSYLKIHSFIHTGEKPYKCEMCEKSFAAPGTLMTHIRTHTGERPHICKICGKDFPQSGYLSAHIRTHTGEKPVECKVCHRRFNQSGRLIIHMRIHSGEKPYACKDCGRSFAVKGTLKKHIRTHTGERPYICSVCGQAFAQSGTLSTHMKVHRPQQF